MTWKMFCVCATFLQPTLVIKWGDNKSKWRPYQFKLIRRCLLFLWHALETSPTERDGYTGTERDGHRVREWEGTTSGTPFSARLGLLSHFNCLLCQNLHHFEWSRVSRGKIWKKWREKGRKKQTPFFISLSGTGTVKLFESKKKMFIYKISNVNLILNKSASSWRVNKIF